MTNNEATATTPAPAAAMPYNGYFGPYGGRFVPETLQAALLERHDAYEDASHDINVVRELAAQLASYPGRPTPLDLAPRLSERVGTAVYLKREDLNHKGAHKVNNSLGQILLARLGLSSCPAGSKQSRRKIGSS